MTDRLADRIRLAEEIFCLIEPDLRLFVFSNVAQDSRKDILQEVLKSVATGMKKFRGDTPKEFWAWCYAITRNKLNDYYRSKGNDRMQPTPPEDLWRMVELSAQDAPISSATMHDLKHAMNLLNRSKPECYDFLWRHFVFGLNYSEIAEERSMSYDNVRMKIGRCLEEAKSLVA